MWNLGNTKSLQDFVKVILMEIQMLSAPVCRQAGWLNAECKLKNAKSPSVNVSTFTRLHVRTLARWKWELEIGKWELGISVFRFLFS